MKICFEISEWNVDSKFLLVKLATSFLFTWMISGWCFPLCVLLWACLMSCDSYCPPRFSPFSFLIWKILCACFWCPCHLHPDLTLVSVFSNSLSFCSQSWQFFLDNRFLELLLLVVVVLLLVVIVVLIVGTTK